MCEAIDVTVVDALSAVFSGLAALGGIIAVIVAVRALTVAREAASVEQLSSQLVTPLRRCKRSVGSALGLGKFRAVKRRAAT